MMDRSVILLDVDGVINAVRPHLPPMPWDDFTETRSGNGFPIFWSRKMIDRLAGFDADIVWLTTWEDVANRYICPIIGWEPREFISPSRRWAFESWWKADAAQRYLAVNPRPLVWLDDDVEWSENEGHIPWLRHYPAPYLLLAPDCEHGLTPGQLDLVETFITEHGRINPDERTN